jgi:hypothetical protein
LPCRGAQEADVAIEADDEWFEQLERFDTYAALRNGLREIARQRGDWAGIPMPLGEDLPLIIEPRYPKAKELMAIGRAKAAPSEDAFVTKKNLRNRFYSAARHCWVIIWNEDGRIAWGIDRASHSFDQQLMTMGASMAWGIEQEANALQLLATMVRHHQFKMYLLAGMFMEASERSGMSYVFRKLRPTVAIRAEGDRMKIRAALCCHNIGYYQNSWAGVMCPTDEVIAHLVMMRADEHRFWKTCNQHPAWLPEAGL